MRIELLRKREDFNGIFCASLNSFLKSYFNCESKITWKCERGAHYLVNDYLNVIYQKSISRNSLGDLTQEFAWNKSWFKHLMQKSYVYFSVRWPFEKYAASATLTIENCPDVLEQWVFIPGNHSIRIIDLANNQSIVFTKLGFNKSFLITDAKIRQEFSLPFVPNILKVNCETGWYTEERIIGLPLNRLSADLDRKLAFKGASENLIILYGETSEKQKLGIYITHVQEKIDLLLATSFSGTTEASKNKICTIKNRLLDCMEQYKDNEITLALTHGDFQSANILYNGGSGNSWLIDWEYANTRNVFYDSLTYELQARKSQGLGQRFSVFLGGLEEGEVRCSWTKYFLTAENSYCLALFLLEDLLVRLEEVAVPVIINKLDSLHPWLGEIMEIRRFCLKK
ncbi:MAG: hypothetical protein COB30_001085 [Ectothiorhodospiraceae bacterium]|nr:hypothetical protein [Ectothiorhodospiraceae bacterium]